MKQNLHFSLMPSPSEWRHYRERPVPVSPLELEFTDVDGSGLAAEGSLSERPLIPSFFMRPQISPLSSALTYAHKVTAHCDIKPGILISGDTLKLTYLISKR